MLHQIILDSSAALGLSVKQTAANYTFTLPDGTTHTSEDFIGAGFYLLGYATEYINARNKAAASLSKPPDSCLN